MQHRTPLQHLAAITNSQKSTGPKTEAGKAVVSQNAVTHGLASCFVVMPWEEAAEYEELYDGFEAEFPPANAVEKELLDSMVQARWLVRRSLLLQQLCFQPDLPACMDTKLALYLRYQTTHERAFHKAYAALLKIKAEREKSQTVAACQQTEKQLGFVSQKRQEASETRKQQQHEAALRVKEVTIRLKEARLLHLETRAPVEKHAIPVAA
jgi:hypothetical protein